MTGTLAFETFGYARHEGIELALDVFRPVADSRRCAVLVFHGGGWRVGSREAVHDRASALAANGFTALAVQYRLLDAAPWPAPLEDAAAALAWARDNAGQLEIEPGNVVVQGHSAGAHIALMSGTLDAALRPAAIAAYYPPIGFHPAAPPSGSGASPGSGLDELGRIPGWMLFPEGTPESGLAAASPIDLLDPAFPPTVVLHGTADRMIPLRSSLTLHSRLVELKVFSELHTYAGRDHEFDRAPAMFTATAATTASFLDRGVVNRARNDTETASYVFGVTAV